MHRLAKVRARGLDEQVIVVSHQAVGVAHQPISITSAVKKAEEASPALVGQKDRSAEVPASRHVVEAARKLHTTSLRNGATLRRRMSRANDDRETNPSQLRTNTIAP
jgi:hypothetical protein